MPSATLEDEFEKVKALLGRPSAPAEHYVELSASAPADLLDRIAAALDGRAPHVVIDCGEFSDENLPKLLAAAKARLAMPCPNYPRLWFRRLEVGLVVIERRIDETPQIAYTKAFKEAARNIIAPPATAKRRAQGFVALLAQIGPRIALMGAIGAWLFERRYPSLYEFYKWYGHRDRPGPRHVPESRLGELNNWAHPAGEHGTPKRRLRDRQLIEAMLADLRHAYNRGRLSKHDWYRSVILLRNSHTRAGAVFRERLRSELAELERLGVPPPPLLVVADGRTSTSDAGDDE
ncbi:hypothetical protein [Glycomyces sp. NPDC021274]|jgi:hypothetical protein|uniref:hypothetical protein n=1 Tax=Glycomyces sp. NPDC021274 TaxID=3155120 RepID=UPI0033E57544